MVSSEQASEYYCGTTGTFACINWLTHTPFQPRPDPWLCPVSNTDVRPWTSYCSGRFSGFGSLVSLPEGQEAFPNPQAFRIPQAFRTWRYILTKVGWGSTSTREALRFTGS